MTSVKVHLEVESFTETAIRDSGEFGGIGQAEKQRLETECMYDQAGK